MIKIIMGTYNGAKYIRDQLDSIRNNSIVNWELYISDDHSTDATLDIVEEFAKEQKQKVHIFINDAEHGVASNFLHATYKVGCSMSEDDYIMFCDQDDIWDNDKIEVTYSEMISLTEKYGCKTPLLVCSDVRVVNERLELIADSFHRMNHYNIKTMDFSHLLMENKVQGCTTMINKALVDQMQYIPRNAYMHDGWCGFIAAVFGKISYIDRPTMLYRQHANNVAGSIDLWQDVKGKLGCLSRQKEIVFRTKGQVKEFIEIYGKNGLDSINYAKAEAFATLEEQNFFWRRYSIIRYGLWKSGVLRNLGLMVLI